MKLILTMLIVATFGENHQTSNFRNRQQVSKGWIEKLNEVPVHSVERYGSSIHKAAFHKYDMEKLTYGPVKNTHSRARFNPWFLANSS